MRYALQQAQPAPATTAGDQSFTALNMKDDPATLQPGEYSLGINKRLVTSDGRRGIAAKRPGTVKPVCGNITPSPYTGIRGSGVYSNPNGKEVLLLADASNMVFQVRDGTYPTAIPIPAGELLDTACEFVQSNDKVLLLRAKANISTDPAVNARHPLIWDGISSTGFVLAAKSDPLNAEADVIPDIETAEAFADRIIFPIPGDPNSFGESDVLDYVTWDPILQKFTVPSGAADGIVALAPWSQGNVIIGKRNQVKVVAGFTEPVVGEAGIVSFPNTTIQKVNDSFGFAARHGWVDRGGDIDFLSEPGGIYAVSQVIQDKIQTSPQPISDPITPLIKRINWRAAGGSRAIVLGDYVYWFFPIDGSLRNNCAAIYNSATGAWEAYDTWAGAISIDAVHVTYFLGQRRVFAVDQVANAVYVLYLGKQDELADGRHEIADRFETRGYAPTSGEHRRSDGSFGSNNATLNDFNHAFIVMDTWRPSISITLLGTGATGSRLLTATPITKSRRRYTSFGVPDFDVSNVNHDFDTPRREDYSIDIPAPPGGFYLGEGGVVVERKQESTVNMSLRTRKRAGIFRIESTQGDCDIKGVLLESTGVSRVQRRGA